MLTTDKLIPIVDTAKAGYSLPQALYCQEDAFSQDMARVIKQKWLLVDHVSRIPKQGQYFLYEVGQESIIVIRENADTVNAFYNVCRHRGSLLCLEQEGARGVNLPLPCLVLQPRRLTKERPLYARGL